MACASDRPHLPDRRHSPRRSSVPLSLRVLGVSHYAHSNLLHFCPAFGSRSSCGWQSLPLESAGLGNRYGFRKEDNPSFGTVGPSQGRLCPKGTQMDGLLGIKDTWRVYFGLRQRQDW